MRCIARRPLQVNETSSAAASPFDFSADTMHSTGLTLAFCEIGEKYGHSLVGDGVRNAGRGLSHVALSVDRL